GKYVFKEMGKGSVVASLGSIKQAKDYGGKPVTLGISPEHLTFLPRDQATPTGEDVFQAVIDLVEPMSSETNFYLQTGSHTIICRSNLHMNRDEEGHRAYFALEPDKIRLFNPETTARIL